MKKIALLTALALLLPALISAKGLATMELITKYATRDDVQHIEANKAMMFFIKAKSPKGAMDGVKKINILNFKEGATSHSYKAFRQDALELFAQSGVKKVKSEKTKEGVMEVYMETKPKISEYSMFMHGKKGGELYMLLEGDLEMPVAE